MIKRGRRLGKVSVLVAESLEWALIAYAMVEDGAQMGGQSIHIMSHRAWQFPSTRHKRHENRPLQLNPLHFIMTPSNHQL